VEICRLVTDHVSDIFLGLDWLQLNQIEWNFGKGEIIMDVSDIDWWRRRRVYRGVDESWLSPVWLTLHGHSSTCR